MHRLRLAILAVATVLAWSAAGQLVPDSWWGLGGLPPDWWRATFDIAVGVVLAYPLVHAFGASDRVYAQFAGVMIVIVPILSVLSRGRAEGMQWVTIAILTIAVGGLVVKQVVQRQRARQRA